MSRAFESPAETAGGFTLTRACVACVPTTTDPNYALLAFRVLCRGSDLISLPGIGLSPSHQGCDFDPAAGVRAQRKYSALACRVNKVAQLTGGAPHQQVGGVEGGGGPSTLYALRE